MSIWFDYNRWDDVTWCHNTWLWILSISLDSHSLFHEHKHESEVISKQNIMSLNLLFDMNTDCSSTLHHKFSPAIWRDQYYKKTQLQHSTSLQLHTTSLYNHHPCPHLLLRRNLIFSLIFVWFTSSFIHSINVTPLSTVDDISRKCLILFPNRLSNDYILMKINI